MEPSPTVVLDLPAALEHLGQAGLFWQQVWAIRTAAGTALDDAATAFAEVQAALVTVTTAIVTAPPDAIDASKDDVASVLAAIDASTEVLHYTVVVVTKACVSERQAALAWQQALGIITTATVATSSYDLDIDADDTATHLASPMCQQEEYADFSALAGTSTTQDTIFF
jgi:hypothetical protein